MAFDIDFELKKTKKTNDLSIFLQQKRYYEYEI